ncbi:MAG TPA: type II toxin-antitoxin system RelE/ParE family toxin [Spirochaetota bacterium]|nr:type II toxin-antitoxin system RelE/ParE family toxin [Spirochaetota bacterium]HRZ27839.1 type II toxin-antitoxin system RelE/ParE family toxin [Spirochaetota bacterium]HSA15673.1 type II toxin-antitoxin system RelE/ParE family toxin [Spirochaetota bacterium]
MSNWIIYYYENDNQCEIAEFLDCLKSEQRAIAVAWIDQLAEHGPNLPRPYADLLKDGIHELRIKLSGNQERILYFFVFKNYIVLTHQFTKHGGSVPEKEIKKAQEIRGDFKRRFKSIDDFKKYLNKMKK